MLQIHQLLFNFIVAIFVVAFSTEIEAEEFDINRLQSRIYSAVAKVKPAVVAINDRGAIFSGVIVTKQGHIISAGHAVRPGRNYTVILADGRQFKTRGLGSNRRVDMAMLKISSPTDFPFAEMGNSSVLVTNQPCIGISHPGLYNRNRGEVIRFGHILQPVTRNEGMIKSTAKMEPGDSGGPLINLKGQVIGIHSNIRRDEESNYDVPVDSFRKHWDELLEPERFYIDGYPSLPKLGFRAQNTDNGVKVTKVYKDSQAEKFGLKANDLVTSIGGTPVTQRTQIYNRLFDLRAAGTAEIFVNIKRDGKTKAVRFKLKDDKLPTPAAFSELENLPSVFATLESKLDDDVFVIRSKLADKSISVRATRIKTNGRGNLVSKSSRVGENPQVELPGGKRIAAEIIGRDSKNDLILFSAKIPGGGGVDLRNVWGDMEEKPGKFLITPHPNSSGKISIWGTKYFNVKRTRMSGGFLGVRIAMDQEDKVFFGNVYSGAAKKAGIQKNDVLLQLDGKKIKHSDEVFSFLGQKDPNTKITALIKRGDKEIKKTIVLGNRTDNTGHVADNLIGGKSLRRDGFSLAISHDADIRPEECGSPVFDLNGQFLGINIARSSRVRSYVVPKTIIKQFVDNIGG